MECNKVEEEVFRICTLIVDFTSIYFLHGTDYTLIFVMAMFEPHLEKHGEQQSSSILDELDKIAPIKSFDAFPKVSRRRHTLITGPIDILHPVEERRSSHCRRVGCHFSTSLGESTWSMPDPE